MRSRLCGLGFLLVASALFAALAINRVALLRHSQTDLTAVGEADSSGRCTAPPLPAPEQLPSQLTICFTSPLRYLDP